MNNSDFNYFLSLEVTDVRCFGPSQKLKLSDRDGCPARWNVILGFNGTGKTTLLQCLALSERYHLHSDQQQAWPRGASLLFLKPSISLLRSAGSRGLVVSEVALQTGLNTHAGTNRTSSEFSADGVSAAIREPEFTGPVCFGYGASRRLGTGSITQANDSDRTATLFSDVAQLRNAEEWLLQLDYAASQKSLFQQQQRSRFDQITKLLVDILPDVTQIRRTTVTNPNDRPRFEFLTPYGWVTQDQISHGYRTLYAWLVDFASRMFERYPDSENPLAEPAVCLVDEIDLHLHPRWQRDLMQHLTLHFPNTQFIVTAHSPLVVQAASSVNGNLALLRREGDHVVIDNDVDAIRNWRIDQILTSDLFGLDSARPPEVERAMKRRVELLSKASITADEQAEVQSLEAQIGPLPAGETFDEAKRMLNLVEETKQLLEKTRKRQ